MTLIECIQSVKKHPFHDYIEIIEDKDLFKKGHLYMASETAEGQLIAEDEEGAPHVIADQDPSIYTDYWFEQHFRLL